ncbi:MAG: hypothetical protein ACLP59_16585 [Bryobacteraceae bacterium]
MLRAEPATKGPVPSSGRPQPLASGADWITAGETSQGASANDSIRLGLTLALRTGAAPCKDNGNRQSHFIGTLGVTQAYSYDGYNRLNSPAKKAGASTVWSETFNYDIYGNRWVPSSSGLSLSALTVTSDAYNTLTNRLTSGNFGYDTAGNETTISPFTVTYDVENRQTGFSSISNGTATYTYDGDGRRVTKTTGGATTTYVYDAKGDLAAEYSTQPPPPPCLTCYVTTDHLGSTRAVTDENAAVTARHDFLPFGEELTTSNRTAALGYGAYDNVMHKYTGQMRDLEGPGLDFFHARPAGMLTFRGCVTANNARYGGFVSVCPAGREQVGRIESSWQAPAENSIIALSDGTLECHQTPTSERVKSLYFIWIPENDRGCTHAQPCIAAN